MHEDATEKPLLDVVPGSIGRVLCFAGTQVPVATMFAFISDSNFMQLFLEEYPHVTEEQVLCALSQARRALEREFGVDDDGVDDMEIDVEVKMHV